jgi:hypothetical protein
MKATKAEVNYSRGMRKRHCGKMDAADTGYCTHFIDRGQKDGECSEVEGRIERGKWCERFDPAI